MGSHNKNFMEISKPPVKKKNWNYSNKCKHCGDSFKSEKKYAEVCSVCMYKSNLEVLKKRGHYDKAIHNNQQSVEDE